MITPRERVNNAIERKPNDRVPYNFRAEPEVYDMIKEAKGFTTDEQVRVWAGSDVRDLDMIFAEGGYGAYSGFGWTEKVNSDGTLEDIWHVRRKKVEYEGGEYTDIFHWPLKQATFAEIKSFDWPDPAKIFDFSTLMERVKSFKGGDRYFNIIETESLFDRCWALRGMEQFMIDMMIEPELADFILAKMSDFFFSYTRMVLEAANGCVDAIGMYNDFGTQNGMMISPETYRELIKPHQQKLIEMAQSYGAKVFYHCCGSVEPIYYDFIDIGVDIIDPLQMRAMDTTSEHLQEAYGDRICFHGGMNTQGFMNEATPDEVAEETEHLIKTLGAGGGYIFSGSHYYQIDIPVKNMEAAQLVISELN